MPDFVYRDRRLCKGSGVEAREGGRNGVSLGLDIITGLLSSRPLGVKAHPSLWEENRTSAPKEWNDSA
ncbi:hypothetical protein ED733_002391 [Metarhizium rileyi]|uniref:Uncharacterized protein n=1 Tax=Metarhizium rileyi (strain RCEF 4871) TaxID=1649241 RepID=A0A5C6G0Y8_METRR|nr:hypothetical protein ED733_002391 [Metarhizium rileyi]